MERKLFISDTPIVQAYQYNAFAMSIAEQHIDFEKWLMDNYIQLWLGYNNTNEYKRISVDFLGGTIFDSVELLHYEDTAEGKDYYANDDKRIIDFILDSIENNKYVCTMLNEFYVPDRISYRRAAFEHDALIYGYSLENRMIYIVGYNDKRHYEKSAVSFEEFCKAFRTKNQLLKRIWVNERPYHFNLLKMKNAMSDYVYGVDCRERLDDYIDVSIAERSFFMQKCNGYPPVCFGSDVYEEVIDYTNYVKEKHAEFDYRCVYAIYEHKELMLKRFELLEKYLAAKYENEKNAYRLLVHNGKLLVSLAVKYRLSKKQENLDSIKRIMQNMAKMEKDCFLGDFLYE